VQYAGVHIFETLKAAREESGLSQRELGVRAGLPQSHISKIEQGKVDLQVSSLLALARVLDLEILPVPRKLVPAIEAILRGDEASSSRRANRTSRAVTLLTRIQSMARRWLLPDRDGESQRSIQRAVAELSNMPLDEPASGQIRAIWEQLKEAGDEPKNAREELLRAAPRLQRLRNLVAHRVSESTPLPTVRPAYTLDEDADA
jgi:transcriptional regulator with XRE-family HTH domain